MSRGQDCSDKFQKKLVKFYRRKKVLTSLEVISVPENEVYVIGSQSNSNAERIRKLGWKPHQPSLFDSVEEQVDFF